MKMLEVGKRYLTFGGDTAHIICSTSDFGNYVYAHFHRDDMLYVGFIIDAKTKHLRGCCWGKDGARYSGDHGDYIPRGSLPIGEDRAISLSEAVKIAVNHPGLVQKLRELPDA